MSLMEALGGSDKKPTVAKSKPRKPDGVFEQTRSVDTVLVLDWLGIEHDGKHARCPGCGESGALIGQNGGLKCLHNRCADVGPPGHPGFRDNTAIVMVVENCQPVEAARKICDRFGLLHNVVTFSRKEEGDDDWKNGLQFSKEGAIKKSLANTCHVFSAHPEWGGVVVYDEFCGAVVTTSKPPMRQSEDPGTYHCGAWTDEDSTRFSAWCSASVGFEPSTQMVDSAVVAVAKKNSVHPVRDYLNSLTWDRTPRLDFMLANYLGAEHSDVTAAIGSKWMISAVARIMQPGCKVDTMPIFEGKQGGGKSSFLRILAGESWFSDTGITIGDKDSYQALPGIWIYELAEMSSVKGREVEKVKSFLSSATDHYRPSYGRRMVNVPRQVVFAATTNESQYLTDTTGNRRFWPVKVGEIDLKAVMVDRDQLWAEAVHRYRADEPWYLDDPAIAGKLHAEQQTRVVADDWIGKIAAWVSAPCRVNLLKQDGVTTQEILTSALEMRPADLHHRHTIRVGGALGELGWTSRQSRENGARVRRYYPGSL